MARFVEFEMQASGRRVAVNVDSIVQVEEPEGDGVLLDLGDWGGKVVRGTLDEVVRKLNGTPETPRSRHPFPGGVGGGLVTT